MKILLATGIYPPEIGGPATYAKLLNDRLPALGYKVNVLPFRIVRRWPKIIRHIVYLFKVIIEGRKSDLIFTQDPVSTGLPALLASKVINKKLVIRVAGDYAWEQGQNRFGIQDGIDDFQHKTYGWRVELLRRIQKWVVGKADKVITPSYYFKKLVSAWNPEADVVCIYNGIELPVIDSPPLREKGLIFSAGRLVPWKGFDVLLEVLRDLPLEYNLVIAGDGPELTHLNSLIKDLGLEGRVKLLGLVPRELVLTYLARASVFVLNTSFESFSFQIVEAMAIGVPVIATNIGNLAEIITDGEEGFLITPNDRLTMCSLIKELSTKDGLRAAVVKKAEIKSKMFSIESTLNALSNLFQRLNQ